MLDTATTVLRLQCSGAGAAAPTFTGPPRGGAPLKPSQSPFLFRFFFDHGFVNDYKADNDDLKKPFLYSVELNAVL